MIETQVSTHDPLLYDFPMPIKQTFYPLGFPVKLHTNSEQVRDAAVEAWGRDRPVFDKPGIELRFAVAPGTETERPPARIPRAQGNLVSSIHSAENYYLADLSRGFVFGWLTPAVIRDRGYFRYHFLESAAYLLLNALYLTPIHAACVGLRGTGLVLCGPSGAGKTSLAFACALRGWEYVSDDASHLVRQSENPYLIVGRPHHIRFRESARQLFDELATRQPSERANGKMDIEIASAEAGIAQVRPEIQAAAIVFLNRDSRSPARLRPFSKERARELLNETVCVGQEPAREAQRESIDRFLELPVLELTYSRLEEAEASLRSFLEERVR